jgi:hypothetical protein
VDNAYNSDPRIAKFKDLDKQEKLAKKKAKQDAAQARCRCYTNFFFVSDSGVK